MKYIQTKFHTGLWSHEYSQLSIPIFKYKGTLTLGVNNYGDTECPACDRLVVPENSDFSLGDACGRCGCEIVGVWSPKSKRCRVRADLGTRYIANHPV